MIYVAQELNKYIKLNQKYTWGFLLNDQFISLEF